MNRKSRAEIIHLMKQSRSTLEYALTILLIDGDPEGLDTLDLNHEVSHVIRRLASLVSRLKDE